MNDLICNWRETDDEYATWQTDCGESFCIIEGNPEENRMNYCTYCGKKLVQHPYIWEGNIYD